MNTAYRVWDGEHMHYWDEDHLSLTIKNDGSWLLWHSSGGLYDPEPFIGEVKMIDGSWCIVNEKKEECRPLFSETATNKVIGDVYQNPELLEGAE
ncbi:YopX family protein [Bacillus velezensis]